MATDREEWVPELGLIRLIGIIQACLDHGGGASDIAQAIMIAQRKQREEEE